MIFNGKSIQSVATKNIYPFLNNLLQSEDETEVRDALTNIKLLVDLGIEKKNFPGLQKVLYHKNVNIARNSFDILRKTSPRVKQFEVKTHVWESMYPFFCKRALSTPIVATDSLKILELLIDYGIVGNYKTLQKALRHNNNNIAHLALNVLRKIKGLPIETRIARIKPVSAESGIRKTKTIVELIRSPLKNLKGQNVVQEAKEIEKS